MLVAVFFCRFVQFHAECSVLIQLAPLSSGRFFEQVTIYLLTFLPLNLSHPYAVLQDRTISMAEKTNYLLFMINAFQVLITFFIVEYSMFFITCRCFDVMAPCLNNFRTSCAKTAHLCRLFCSLFTLGMFFVAN